MIPRIINQVWVGPPIPERLAIWMGSWRDMHPDWEYRLWRDGDLDWLEHRDIVADWERLAPRNRGQFVSDIARLEIVHRFGGIYIDSDMEPVRRLDALLEPDCWFAWHRPAGWQPNFVAQAFFGAVPKHPILEALISGIPESVAEYAGLRAPYTVGGRYVTRRLMESGLLGDLHLYPAEWFYPYQPEELTALSDSPAEAWPQAYAIHRWHNRTSGNWAGKEA